MRARRWVICLWVLGTVWMHGDRPGAGALEPMAKGPAADAPSGARPVPAFSALPMSFEQNEGQADSRISYLARGAGYSVSLSPTESTITLSGRTGTRSAPAPAPLVVRTTLLGAAKDVVPVGVERLPGKVNYFIGNDREAWKTNIATFEKVAYNGVYEGIDLLYYGNGGRLEYDFIVHPGRDPRTIEFEIDGVDDVSLDADGRLVLRADGGDLTWAAPVAYQTIGGTRKSVAARFVKRAPAVVAFEVGAYDATQPLTIDPVLEYSTYLGIGTTGTGITVDSLGRAYVTGLLGNLNSDVFVSQISADGSSLLYSTYFGGMYDDYPSDIAIDSVGNAYVVGVTTSPNFPTVNALQGQIAGISDAFIVKINATGSVLAYSTYLGGPIAGDRALGVAVDTLGQAVIVGTTSADFPTQNPFANCSSFGQDSGFLAKLSASGSAFVFSSCLGPGLVGADVALDLGGNAYVTGTRNSTWQSAMVMKVDASGAGVPATVWFGNRGGSAGWSIAADALGSVFVTGSTREYPTVLTNDPFLFNQTCPPPDFVCVGAAGIVNASQPAYGGGVSDAFVVKLNSTDLSLAYGTFLGGVDADEGRGIAVDGAGRAYVTGLTLSADLPTLRAFQPTIGGGNDAFVTSLTADGTHRYSTYLGGTTNDFGYAVATDSGGAAYVTGYTNSTNFPTANAFQPTGGSGVVAGDAFVSKLSTAPVAVSGVLAVSEDVPAAGALLASDPGGLPLTFSVVSNGAAGTAVVTNAATGAYSYTPYPNISGNDAFTFKASNGEQDSKVATVTVTITAVNDAPVASSGSASTTANTPVSGTLLAIDIDNPALTYSVVTNGTLGTAAVTDATTGAFTYTPTPGASGVDSFEFRASDGLLDSNTATVTMTISPGAPTGATLEVIHSFTGCVPTGCWDGDDGSQPVGALIRSTSGVIYGTTGAHHAGLGAGTVFAVSPTGTYSNSYTFNQSWIDGCFPFGRLHEVGGLFYGVTQSCGLHGDGTLFAVSPGGGFVKLHDFTDGIPANSGYAVGSLTTGSDGLLYGISRHQGANGLGSVFRREADGTITTIHSFNGTDGQWPSGELVRASDGSIYGTTVDGGSALPCSFGGGSCGSVFRIRPSGVFEVVHSFLNNVGHLGAYPEAGVVEATDGNFYGMARVVFRLAPDGTYTELHNFDPVTQGFGNTGLLTQATDGNLYGVLTDGGPTGKGGIFRMTLTGTVTMLHAFAGPEGARPFGGMIQGADGHLYGTTYAGGARDLGVVFRVKLLTAESSTLAAVEDTASTGTLVATEPNGLPLTYELVSNGTKGTATVVDALTGAYTYVPNPDASGSDSFTFRATSGSALSNVATISVTIAPVNDAPIAAANSFSTPFGVPVGGALSATDIDSAALTYSVVSNGTLGTAVVTNAATGAYTYTPGVGSSGADSFTFKANDGGLDSNVTTVAVTIGANALPVATDGTLTTLEDSAGSGTLQGADPDQHSITFSIVGSGAKGTALVTNATTGAYTYTPNPNANGSDAFTFRVNDGTGNSNIATVVVSITAVNDAPTAAPGSLSTNEGVSASGTLSAADIDGQPLTFSIVTNGAKGVVTIVDTATGAFSYVPTPGASGSDAFTFKANDGSVDSNVAAIDVTITPNANQPPTATTESYATPRNSPLVVGAPGVLGNDTDADGDSLTAVLVSGPAHGTLVLSPNGAFTYTPAAGYGGQDSFSYRASDGVAVSNTVAVSLTVTAPVIGVNPTALNFGGQTVGSPSAALSVTVTNTGDAVMSIAGVSVSGVHAPDFTQSSTCGSAVGVGASCSISVTFRPGATGGRTALLQISTNATAPLTSVTLSGSGVVQALRVLPTTLTFADQIVGTTSARQVVTVTNIGNTNVTVRNPTITGSESSDFVLDQGATTCGGLLSPGASCRVAVRFSPRAAGRRAADIHVTDTAGGDYVVFMSGNGVRNVTTITPAALSFGDRRVGTTSPSQRVTIRNVGAFARLLNIQASGDFNIQDTTCGARLANGASCFIDVVFRPSSPGQRTGTLSLRADGDLLTASLSGLGSVAAVTPNILAFVSVAVGGSSPRGFSIQNVSNTFNLIVSSLVLTGSSDFSIAPQSCGTIAPLSQCRVIVTFRPTRRGIQRADVTIGFSGDGSPRTVTIVGTGR